MVLKILIMCKIGSGENQNGNYELYYLNNHDMVQLKILLSEFGGGGQGLRCSLKFLFGVDFSWRDKDEAWSL